MRNLLFWLKILIGAYAIVFVLWAICFADMDATQAISTAPAYNACNGYFVEEFGATACEIKAYSLPFVFDTNYIVATPCEVLCYSLPFSINKVMDATALIESPPAYDACDGAFIESFTLTPCEVLCYSLPMVLTSNVIELTPCEVLVYSEKIGNQRKFGQHRTHAQGRGFAGDAGLQWELNNNAGYCPHDKTICNNSDTNSRYNLYLHNCRCVVLRSYWI